MNALSARPPAKLKSYRFSKWIIRGTACAFVAGLAVAAVLTGNRMLAIVALGVPAVAGAASLAITYGQRNSYG